MALLDPPLNWQHPTLDKLWITLIDAYRVREDVEILADTVGIAPGTFPFGSDMRNVWKALIDEMAAQNKLRLLIERAQAEKEAPNYQAVFMEVLDRHNNPIAHAVNEQTFEEDSILLLDRKPLRDRLALLEPDAKRAKTLLLRGERKSGKSYGRFLFDSLAKERGAISIYLDGVMTATVEEVIFYIFTTLGASNEIPPNNLTSRDAYYRVVWLKIKEILIRNNKTLWIAMDELGLDQSGGPLIDSQIKLFFDQFVPFTKSPDFAERFRLMLIDYPDEPTPTKAPAKWERDYWIEDRISRADVDLASVTTFLKGWVAARGKTWVDAEMDQLVGEIIALGDAAEAQAAAAVVDETALPPPTRLEVIHDALLAKIEHLKGQSQ
jgi:hypothetical protein